MLRIGRPHGAVSLFGALVVIASGFVSGQSGAPPGTSAAQQTPVPTFRSGVELVSIDVTVLDRNRQPVLGLTAADFELYDAGVLRPVETLAVVAVPPPAPPPPAAWMNDVAPDVVVNSRLDSDGRVVVIVVDDGSFQQEEAADLTAVQKTRLAAREVVKGLGPSDVAAVVFTSQNRTAQNFTADRALLHAAIDRAPLFPSPTRKPGFPADQGDDRGDCLCGQCSLDVVRRVSESLAGASERRKILFYVSVGRTFDLGGTALSDTASNHSAICKSRRGDAMAELLKAAQAANVTIQAIDPGGLRADDSQFLGDGRLRLDFLRTVAEGTGGRAVVNNNDPEREVPALLLESSSYYLLGFRPIDGSTDDRPRELRVRVKRPGLEVLARRSYVLPKGEPRSASFWTSTVEARLDSAIARPLPVTDVPLAVGVAAFRDGDRRAALAIVLGVPRRDPAQAADAIAGGSRTATVDVKASAFGPEGEAVGSHRQTLRLAIPSTLTDAWEYESLSRIAVPPGRYEVRVAIQTDDERTGSVYTHVTVPAFDDAPLALSGMALGATPAPPTAPRNAFADLIPIVPTARRAFRPSDRVTTFLRAYQQGVPIPKPAVVRLRVVDANDRAVVDESRNLAAEAFSSGAADILLPLVLEGLRPGDYLVIVDVTADERTEGRSIPIRIH